jgi:predicted Rossmann fold flavoprotein
MIETDICIIGAGPAGMMAAIAAAERSGKIIILESNTTAGRKLLLTGRGRCNLTHTGTIDEFIRAYKPFDRFVRHCIYEFPPEKLRGVFACHGLETVEEPDGCVFPKNQRSSDIKQILIEELKKPDIRILYGKKAQSVRKDGDIFVILSEKFKISTRSVIIATGGVSWPQTGSTGDGYKFTQDFGHNIIEPKACLTPLITVEKFCSTLAGIGVKNVRIFCTIDGKRISANGPMIFTHNGIGGPAVFDLSRIVADHLNKSKKNLIVSIDLLPDIKPDELDKKLADCFTKNPGQTVVSMLSQFLPKALARQLCIENLLEKINVGQINKKSRKNLVQKLKNFPLSIVSTEPIEKATVTRGGIDTADIDPKTMQSRQCSGLFFAGEVINVDGPCGGYNLQFAFSSGFLAGKSAVESLK